MDQRIGVFVMVKKEVVLSLDLLPKDLKSLKDFARRVTKRFNNKLKRKFGKDVKIRLEIGDVDFFATLFFKDEDWSEGTMMDPGRELVIEKINKEYSWNSRKMLDI